MGLNEKSNASNVVVKKVSMCDYFSFRENAIQLRHTGNTYRYIIVYVCRLHFKPLQTKTTLKQKNIFLIFQSVVLMASWNLKLSNGSRQPQNFVLVVGRNKRQIIITWNFLLYFQIKVPHLILKGDLVRDQIIASWHNLLEIDYY